MASAWLTFADHSTFKLYLPTSKNPQKNRKHGDFRIIILVNTISIMSPSLAATTESSMAFKFDEGQTSTQILHERKRNFLWKEYTTKKSISKNSTYPIQVTQISEKWEKEPVNNYNDFYQKIIIKAKNWSLLKKVLTPMVGF